MKNLHKSFAIVMASLVAGGAFAVDEPTQNAPIQREQTAVRATKKNEKAAKKRVAKRKAKAAVKAGVPADRISSSSSSATSAATVSPGLTAGASTTQAAKVARRPKFTDNLRAAVLFEYYGASITEPLSGYQTDKVDGFSQGNTAVELYTRATLGYKITPNIAFNLNGYFLNHGSNYDAASGIKSGDAEAFAFKPAQSFFQVSVGKFAEVNNFKWNGDFRLYPGLGIEGEGVPVYLRTGQNFFYTLSPTLSLAAYNTIRYYHRTSAVYDADAAGANNKIDLRITLGPAINYQVGDTFGLSLSFNKEYSRVHNTGEFAPSDQIRGPIFGQYVELGASWDLHKRVNLNPYVDMFTATPNIEAMQMGANLNISIL